MKNRTFILNILLIEIEFLLLLFIIIYKLGDFDKLGLIFLFYDLFIIIISFGIIKFIYIIISCFKKVDIFKIVSIMIIPLAFIRCFIFWFIIAVSMS